MDAPEGFPPVENSQPAPAPEALPEKPKYMPMPEMPDDFPSGQIVKELGIRRVRALSIKYGHPMLYDDFYRQAKGKGIDRAAASLWARRKAAYFLWETYKEGMRKDLTMKGLEPHEILAEVKRSGRTCDFSTLLDWVADHILTPWESIDIDTIPDPKAVNWLADAKADGGAEKFWSKFAQFKAKKNEVVDEDTAEKGLRKADERATAELIRDFKRALKAIPRV